MNSYNVSVISGDGIGPEITEATLEVLSAVQKQFNLSLNYVRVDAGDTCLQNKGVALPEETIHAIRNSHVCLKGPVGETAADVIVKLRLLLDLYANIRPIKSFPDVPSLWKDIDLVIVRENTEDLYKGLEFTIGDDVAIGLRVITRKNSHRIAQKAFTLAQSRNRQRKVTVIHKTNVLKKTGGLFAGECRTVAKQYPEIILEEQYVDAASMRLVKEPQKYDVIVTTNLFGDILSDLAAQLIGGLGMAPGGNIGDHFALFEPIHGSAPRRVGKHTANPCSMILAAKMMLEWLGEKYQDSRCFRSAQAIETSVERIFSKKLTVPDFGGTLTTLEMAKAIAKDIS